MALSSPLGGGVLALMAKASSSMGDRRVDRPVDFYGDDGGDDGGDDDDDDDDGDGSSGEQGMGVGAAADRKCLVTASRPSTRSMIISTAVPPMIILMAINDHFNNYQY